MIVIYSAAGWLPFTRRYGAWVLPVSRVDGSVTLEVGLVCAFVVLDVVIPLLDLFPSGY
jgi:hypothetical protein